MTLAGYQLALSDCIASAQLCLEVRRDPAEALAPYPLTQRERHRIETAARQRGMSISCSLYRMNRITPLATLLPLTSTLLGDDFVALAEAFWQERRTDMQFRTETHAFRDFLLRQPHAAGPYLREVLDFEIAANRLRFRPGTTQQVAVVRFQHDPVALLEALTAGRVPPPLEEGTYSLTIDASGGDLQLSLNPPSGV